MPSSEECTQICEIIRKNGGAASTREIAALMNWTTEKTSHTIGRMRRFRLIGVKCPTNTRNSLVWELRKD